LFSFYFVHFYQFDPFRPILVVKIIVTALTVISQSHAFSHGTLNWILAPTPHFRISTKWEHHPLSTDLIAEIKSSIYSSTHPFIQQSFHPGEKKQTKKKKTA